MDILVNNINCCEAVDFMRFKENYTGALWKQQGRYSTINVELSRCLGTR